ncbi:MAG: PD-(D/E)XK nuclease family protein [bacterium]
MKVEKLIDSVKDLFFKNKNVIDLSYSRIKSYQFCPIKYKLIYEQNWKGRLHAPSSLGLSLHRALEQFHKNNGHSIDVLIGYLEEYWVNNGFESAEEAYENFHWAKDALCRYFDNWQKEKVEILYVEKEFVFNIGNIRIQGIIDRIDRSPDGSYEVIDYKTRVNNQSRGSEDYVFQLGIYYLACEKALGIIPQKLSVYNLATGEKLSKQFDGIDKKHLINELKNAAKEIGKKEYKPSLNNCGKCEFNIKCPKS